MKDNGGQAFPSESMYTSEAGMTLRDYFAAKAMQAWIPTYGIGPRLAEQAYQVVDAMLKARKAGGAE
ncbi:hypothetical protein ACM7V5_29785 [Pseudomonas aeruginosa]